MPLKLIFSLAILTISQCAFSQSDTLNNYNSNKEKVGWWITYLNKDLKPLKDSNQAVYYKYSYFEGDFDYYPLSQVGTEKSPIISKESTYEGETAIPLDGEYKTTHKNGKTKFLIQASNGKLIKYSEFYKNGNLKHTFNYTEMCGDTFLNYCIYLYEKDGSLKLKTTFKQPKR